jgi:hypothetical protein
MTPTAAVVCFAGGRDSTMSANPKIKRSQGRAGGCSISNHAPGIFMAVSVWARLERWYVTDKALFFSTEPDAF